MGSETVNTGAKWGSQTVNIGVKWGVKSQDNKWESNESIFLGYLQIIIAYTKYN